MESIKIIKIGGNVVDNEAALQDFLEHFASVGGCKILVHGGGKVASTVGRALGIEPVMIGGRRVTDPHTLEVVTMVYGGLINKKIVAALQGLGCRALGLTGADGALIRSARRASTPVDYGEVGDPVSVNRELLVALLEGGYTPVIAPLTLSEQNTILNTNADTMAQTLASAFAPLCSTGLIYTFEMQGVMSADQKLIPHITPELFERFKADGTVSGGMLPKIENALKAVRGGVASVQIGGTTITL